MVVKYLKSTAFGEFGGGPGFQAVAKKYIVAIFLVGFWFKLV